MRRQEVSVDMHTVEARLGALERQNRNLRAAGGAVLGMAVAAALVVLTLGGTTGQAATENAIQAERITIVDAAGKPRLSMGVMDDQPFLLLRDGSDRVRMVLSLGVEGSTLQYYDTNGKRRVALAETGPGAGLEFYDPMERRRVALLTTADTPALVFADAQARTRMLIGIGSDGPDIELYGENSKRRLALGAREEAGPRFALFDQDGLVRLAAGVAASGPALILSDDRIQPRLQLEVGNDGPELILKHGSGRAGTTMMLAGRRPALAVHDPNGAVVFSAP
ncbi:MAG: hypothetical protein ACREAA_07885 [Candidatus Polarisedimenticolia bacterium]